MPQDIRIALFLLGELLGGVGDDQVCNHLMTSMIAFFND
jgi:hypothetical protein